MKQIYPTKILFILVCSLAFYLPDKLNAQCTCSGGLPATPISYTITKPPTNSSTIVYTFPQFDPSIGTLSCVNLKDTITGISTTGALNTGPDTTAFLFQLTLNNKITGPGITITQAFNKIYGYDTLTAYGTPRDTITYGPDTVFNHAKGSGSTGGNAAYLGLGTVDFIYKINGGMIALDGGLNYKSGISTTIGGTLKLTYYWCPAGALANGIGQFTIIKFGNTAVLQWIGENEQNNNYYDIEYSKDGVHFTSLGSLKAIVSDSSSSSNYQYKFSQTTATGVRAYFRIKKTDAAGKASYSAVKGLDFGGTGSVSADFHIYPNPSTRKIHLESSNLVSGNLRVSIISVIGQVLYNQGFQLNASNHVSFELPSSITKGVYYLQVTDLNGNAQQISKLFVQEP